MYRISFYVPAEKLEEVKNAMFEAGAGRIGSYDMCCWQTAGEGQFRPLSGSNPYVGHHGKVERVSEYLVEMVCGDSSVKDAVEAMKKAHPYEEPAYGVWKLSGF